ncbi:hypothetical protein FNV43_RR25399 [Rhamnella rubrinervis]|uniref:Uncharacterized protein n=1 Tax=Rhamnella rubrinervis TaxID=2594499 RepID=A0A8K0DT29_9ROSA|nr:hypothetical protein FNV43_RR25399 [Rhamnella rubrinervis]
MSLSLKLASVPSSSSFRLVGCRNYSYPIVNGVCARFWPSKLNHPSLSRDQFRKLCSVNGDGIDAYGSSDGKSRSTENEGTPGKNNSGLGVLLTSNESLKKLRRYGIAGLLSYGLLNTGYYLTTFLLVWFYVAPVPGRMGYLAAVERFLKVMAMVWAGSQVTKLIRAGGALALAPFVDRGLSWFTERFKFKSQGQAFMSIVAFCFGLAIMLFFIVTLLWA